MKAKEEDKTFRLQRLHIHSIDYGEEKGTFKGSVTFSNKTEESFTFRLDDERCRKYLDLIADDVVKSAEALSKDLAKTIREFK